MQPLKIRQLSVVIFSAYFCAYGFTTSVEFEPCFPAIKNQPCNMTCRVQDLTQAVDFNCNGTSRGACLSGVFCNPSIIEGGGGSTLYFQIPSLSYASDICDWTCTYGASSSSVLKPTIFSGFSGSLILSNQTNEDKINLTGTADCVYPYNTTVQVQYRDKDTSGQYQSLTQQVDVQSIHVPGNCGFDIEKRIVATYEVSKKNSLLGGKIVFLRMEFLQYLSATPSYTNDVGPFIFEKSSDSEDCSQDIFLYGFLPVFLIVHIASIAINILKIDFLSKQFGEFTWKKVGITAVFCVIAIIIGVCLGLLIKGCDKKLLALGLSLFFGILIVVALIFALIYYHKKCESGSDIQDGDGGEDSNRSSQNNTGSNTTRTGTGRVGLKSEY